MVETREDTRGYGTGFGELDGWDDKASSQQKVQGSDEKDQSENKRGWCKGWHMDKDASQ